MPFFTVVLPLYNKKPHVARAVASVLAQEFTDFELIIVDDASTDGSLDELALFDDARMVVLKRSEPGPGGYAARNLAISQAKGKYIAFLDADDEWAPEHLVEMHRLASSKPDAIFLASAYRTCSDRGSALNCYARTFKERGVHTLRFSDFLEAFLKYDRVSHTSVTVVVKAVIEDMGGFPAGETRKGGDLYTWLNVVKEGQVAWSPHVGATVYHNAVNQVTRHESFSPEFLCSIYERLSPRLSQQDRSNLKAYVDLLLTRDYIRTAISGRGRAYDVRKYILQRSFFKRLKVSFLYLVPPSLFSGLRMIKRRFFV
jgi:glycosyltransferase involved in cell wall biosynthesis